MRRNLHCLLILLLLSAQNGFSQAAKIEKPVIADKISPELRKEAVAFLRETFAEVGTLRTLENRISFSSEMAGLMWFSDEKEARAMYQAVINDFRQLLAQYDSQANASGENAEDETYTPSFFGGGNNAARKLRKALDVRRQIATGLAEHDAPLALEFFTGTAQAVGNPKIRKQLEAGDSYFETQLLAQIAARDVDTALKYARKSLAKKFDFQLIEVLKKIYEKDADKGAAFGEEIVQKIKSETSSGNNLSQRGSMNNDISQLGSILELGAGNLEKLKGKTGKKPMFSEQSMREIADLLVKELLSVDTIENSGAMAYISQIEKFSPVGAARVRQKFSARKQTEMRSEVSSELSMAPPRPRPRPSSSSALKIESAQDGEKQLMENVQSLGTKKLSIEEREKTIGQARKSIASLRDPNKKLLALSVLASQVSALGDKEIAGQILDEARNLVNPQPKNYMEFMQNWMLASAYAQVDAQRAFPVLEETILRLNDTIGAFMKVGEFVDVGGEMIEDGEAQVGGFSGAMTRELTRGLGASDLVIRNLAKSDFARTKDLTGKFDRPEVRILAKMIVLRALFDEREEKTAEQVEIIGEM